MQDGAEALYIHPFMLSRWRKQAGEGLIMTKGVDVDKDVAAELKALRRMKRDYERLKLEHEKKPSSSLQPEKRHLCLHRSAPGALPGEDDVQAARSFITTFQAFVHDNGMPEFRLANESGEFANVVFSVAGTQES